MNSAQPRQRAASLGWRVPFATATLPALLGVLVGIVVVGVATQRMFMTLTPALCKNVAISSADGTQLQANYCRPQDSSATRLPAAVLAHGLTNDWVGMRDLASQFHAQGFATISITLRGHSDSGGALPHPIWPQGRIVLPFAQLGADVQAGVDFLSTQPEVDNHRILLVGYSLGGAAVFQAACTQSNYQAVIALSIAGNVDACSPPSKVRNLLLVVGDRDMFFPPATVLDTFRTFAGANAQPGQTVGAFTQGSARRLVFIPGEGHSTARTTVQAYHEVLAWSAEAAQTTLSGSPTATGNRERQIWMGVGLVGELLTLLAALFLLHRLFAPVDVSARAKRVPAFWLLAGLGVWAVAGVLVWPLIPAFAVFPLIGGNVLLALFLPAALGLAALVWHLQLIVRSLFSESALGLALGVLAGVLSAVLNSVTTHHDWPSPQRALAGLVLWFVVAAALLAWGLLLHACVGSRRRWNLLFPLLSLIPCWPLLFLLILRGIRLEPISFMLFIGGTFAFTLLAGLPLAALTAYLRRSPSAALAWMAALACWSVATTMPWGG